MPIFWFAIGRLRDRNWPRITLIFFILHLLVYPASNGYNSYMDRDEGSIGGLKNPAQPTRQLFVFTVAMDLAAIGLGMLVSAWFTLGLAAYIGASRAYSARSIRIKKHPFWGYLTVVFFQGAGTFFLVYHGGNESLTLDVPAAPMLASSLLVGGFYPLTQVYQHDADLKDGVRTISWRLGIRGTFVFSAIIFGLAMGMLGCYFRRSGELNKFVLLSSLMAPILVYFMYWARQVWLDSGMASFEKTMKMNLLASCCMNLAFIAQCLMK